MRKILYLLTFALVLSCYDESNTDSETIPIIFDTTYQVTGIWTLCKLSAYGSSTHFDRCPELIFYEAQRTGTYDSIDFSFLLKDDNVLSINFGESSKDGHFFRQNRDYVYKFNVMGDLLYFDLQDNKGNKYHLSKSLSPAQ